jgi:diguanylate cyclase (GGDEF)-like protein
MGGTHKVDEIERRLESDGRAISAAEAALVARERAVLVREQAADRREDALATTARLPVYDESELREANEQLVVAAVRAQTTAESAQQAAALMSIKAERDALTGLPNRALLADRLAHSIELALRHGKKVAVMFMDLDNFKAINDSLGHAVGDGLLQSVAKRLQASVRASDTVSRQGGDEFVVLLTEVATVQHAAIVADKLIRKIREPHLVGRHLVRVTLSIGISLYPDDGKDGESILMHADAAMYVAKKSGRNNYRQFSPDMHA